MAETLQLVTVLAGLMKPADTTPMMQLMMEEDKNQPGGGPHCGGNRGQRTPALP